MSNIMKVSFPQRIDSDKLSAMLTAEIPAEIEVTSDYIGNLPATVLVNDFASDEIEAFIKVLDKLTASAEVGKYIFSIEKTGKVINLENSFFRDSEIIPKPKTAIPDGSTIIIRFEIPGFEINDFREIPLYFNTNFNPADLLVLEEIGITLTGNGSEFEISNAVECKLSFSKPEASEIEYIIDFQLSNKIIPADE